MIELVVRNRQDTRHVDLPLFRRIARTLLTDLVALEEYDLGVHLIAAPEMTRLNGEFLKHQGATDVITFDYADPAKASLHGEVFLCLDEAVTQAKRFRSSWQSELVRYLVHGVLHLQGFGDSTPGARRELKREENRLLRLLARTFPLNRLAGSRSRRTSSKS
jgi:rRNA maturation RNase YbeY